mgnify:CR=1 FL=1
MARPLKNGLDYFPFDVDFFSDEKIAAISGEFGVKGEITAIKLLCAIYRNGYYIEWNDMLKMKLLKDLPGITEQLLDSIVSRLVRWGFFDAALFDSTAVLTSEGIQRRYFAIAKRRRNTEYPYVVMQGFGCPDGVSRHPDPDKPSFAERTETGRDEAEEKVSACNNGVSACNNPVSGGLLQTKTLQIKEKEIKNVGKEEEDIILKQKKESREPEWVRRAAPSADGMAYERLRDVKDIAGELVHEEAWIEQLCTTFKLEKEQVKAKILSFPGFIVGSGERTMRTVSSFKRFFFYTLKKQMTYGDGTTGIRPVQERAKTDDDPYAAHRRRYGLE